MPEFGRHDPSPETPPASPSAGSPPEMNDRQVAVSDIAATLGISEAEVRQLAQDGRVHQANRPDGVGKRRFIDSTGWVSAAAALMLVAIGGAVWFLFFSAPKPPAARIVTMTSADRPLDRSAQRAAIREIRMKLRESRKPGVPMESPNVKVGPITIDGDQVTIERR